MARPVKDKEEIVLERKVVAIKFYDAVSFGDSRRTERYLSTENDKYPGLVITYKGHIVEIKFADQEITHVVPLTNVPHFVLADC